METLKNFCKSTDQVICNPEHKTGNYIANQPQSNFVPVTGYFRIGNHQKSTHLNCAGKTFETTNSR